MYEPNSTGRERDREGGRPISVCIADDHAIFRAGLRRLIESEPGLAVVGEASTGEETLSLVRDLEPDLLILDLAMPRLGGLGVLRELAASPGTVCTLLLTAGTNRDTVVEALHLGARGIVLKESAVDVLLDGIRAVAAGEYWIDRERAANLGQSLAMVQAGPPPGRADRFDLTPRERQVLSLVVAGCTNRDLARQLGVTEDTVKHHLTNVFNKTGASTRLELALFAIHHHLVDPG